MEIQKLSRKYAVRKLNDTDIDNIYEVMQGNPQYFQYCPPMATAQSIADDMNALPPRTTYDDKYYIGYFEEEKLVAVMDLIEHYPSYGTALLGFFAMNPDLQRRGIGTEIISDSIDYLAQLGIQKVRLGIDKGNPQSKAFWLKNGFTFTGEEYENDGSTILVMERNLYD